MSLITLLATPLKTLLRTPSTATRSMVAATTCEFEEPVDFFIRQALAKSNLLNADQEIAAAHAANVTNMGTLKAVNLDQIGLSVGAKTAIATALTDAKTAAVKASIKRELSLTECKQKRAM